MVFIVSIMIYIRVGCVIITVFILFFDLIGEFDPFSFPFSWTKSCLMLVKVGIANGFIDPFLALPMCLLVRVQVM
jgi:hypothetical protein